MSEFERKLIQGVHDDRWTGKITGVRYIGGVREYPIEPDDQDVNPDRSTQVVVFTADALAAELRKAQAEAWDEGARWAAVECGTILHEGQEFLAPGDNPYRLNEGEKQ